jgi:molybdopterin-guanine dinucleotide biosynthesis protein A
MSGVAGIVLCGGLSSRMGRPKAWLPWRGRPMLVHVVGVLREVVDEVLVVASRGQVLPATGARVVEDREPELGPLAAIREGLLAMGAERAYVTSTDAPLLTPGFVRALLAAGAPAAPELDGVVQPLAAVYPKVLAREAGRLLAAGRGSAIGLLESAGFRRVAAGELPDSGSLRSLDTPRDYLEALRRDEPGARATLVLRERTLEVAVGTLGEVLALAGIADPDRYAVRLAGCERVSDPGVPVGRERVDVARAAGG